MSGTLDPTTARGGPNPSAPPPGRSGPPRQGSGSAGGPRTIGRKPPAGPPLVVAAAVTTGWAAIVSATPVLLAVAAVLLISPTPTDSESVLRGGFGAWLLAHGVPVQTRLGPVTLAPLAITALAAWRVVRAGVHAARAIGVRHSRSVLPALRTGLAVGVAYGLYGGAAAAAVSTAGLRLPVLRAGLTLAAFGLVAGLIGALREGGWPARWAPRIPGPVRDSLRTGLVAVLLMLASGAAATGLALALSAGVATEMMQEYRTGVVGQVGLVLVCLVYAPNVAVWGASYLVGPGFSIGVGTKVSTVAVTLGRVPAVPVLAALPDRPLAAWSAVLLGTPLVAGLAAGWLLARRLRREHPAVGWLRLLCPAALAGPVAGGALALAATASGGSLGGGRLVQVGASAWPLALVGAVGVTAGALVAAAATRGIVLMAGRKA